MSSERNPARGSNHEGARLVWITGAHGFIGRHLAAALDPSGATVVGIGHGAWSAKEAARNGFSHWLNSGVSLGSLGQLRSVTGDPNLVFHLAGGSSVGAAITNPYEDFRRTVTSTLELLEWLRQCSSQTRLVATSSAAVYGAGHTGRIAETDHPSPCSPYGSHKLIMEELCRSYAANYGIRVMSLRLFSVYGRGLKKQLLWDLCENIASGAPIELGGTGEELRDWVHVDDVARCLIAAAEFADSSAPVLNLGSGIATRVREIAAHVVEAWQPPPLQTEVAFSGRLRPGDPFSLVANVARMHSRGLATSIPVSAGIEEYVNWYRGLTGTGA